MKIFEKIKNKLKTNNKNIKIIKFMLLVGKIYCLVSLPNITFLMYFNESRVVNIFAFITLILNTLIAIDIHCLELDVAEYNEYEKENNEWIL